MALYPGREQEQRFPFTELRDRVARIFMGAGMGADDAHLLADTLATADLPGIHSHGVLRVPDYVAKLTTGGADPRDRPRWCADRGALRHAACH